MDRRRQRSYGNDSRLLVDEDDILRNESQRTRMRHNCFDRADKIRYHFLIDFICEPSYSSQKPTKTVFLTWHSLSSRPS
jgi:hypothetical protein